MTLKEILTKHGNNDYLRPYELESDLTQLIERATKEAVIDTYKACNTGFTDTQIGLLAFDFWQQQKAEFLD